MKHVILVALTAISCTLVQAQVEEQTNDQKALYGFSIGWNKTNLRLSSQWQSAPIVTSRGGFNLGIVADYTITKFLSLSPKLALSFHDSKILLTDIAAPNVVNVMPVLVDVHAHVNVHSHWGKLDPYFIFGPRYSIPLPQEESDFIDYDNNQDVGIDAGIGFTLKKHDIHFSPEIRYSVSSNSAVVSLAPNVYRETLSFVLVFKG